MMASSETCREKVDRGSYRMSDFQPCGRKIERDGLCKLHLRVEENRRKKWAEFTSEMEQGKALRSEAKTLARRLGTHVEADYSTVGKGGYTGNFTVDGDWLRQIAEGKSA